MDANTTINVHTRRIAEFVSELSYERIPAEVRARIKLLILDSLGCAIYGADLEWCRILRETLRHSMRPAPRAVWGTERGSRRRTPRWSTARRCRASSWMTFTARRCCTSAR